MTTAPPLHAWDLTTQAAVELQHRLRQNVRILDDTTDWPLPLPDRAARMADGLPVLVAGVDASYAKGSNTCHAAVVVWDAQAQRVVESVSASGTTDFPYVPGLLTFREGPIVLEALARLTCRPGAYMFDGQGIAHPRRFGIACHMGLWLDAPTIGCAKTRLCGEHDTVRAVRGEWTPLVLGAGERIGAVVCTRDNCNPFFVSPGHLASHRFAIELVLACDSGYRSPQPVRLADQETKRLLREG
ncbi:MAG: endonuclease V [Planctomycetota bacterium]